MPRFKPWLSDPVLLVTETPRNLLSDTVFKDGRSIVPAVWGDDRHGLSRQSALISVTS